MILVRVLMQTVALALGQLWANKVRAMLTTLGIIIAVGAVITTIAGVNGLRQYVLKEFETFGTKKVYIDGWLPRNLRGRVPWHKVELVMREVDYVVKNSTTMARFSPLFFGSYDAEFADQKVALVQTTGIWPAWHEIENRQVITGRPFNSMDDDQRLAVCLVNEKLVELLSLPREPSGTPIRLSGRRFLVVGVVETKDQGFMFGGGGEQQAEIYLPLSVAMGMQPQRRHVNFLLGELKSPDLADEAKAEVSAMLRRVRALPPAQENTFQIEVMQSFIDQFNKMARAFTAGMGGLVAVSLLVGGIGIMNIMLVSVSERTREIGLRKAVGARPGIVLMQFLVEAVVLCLVGGLIGLACGQGLVMVLRAIPDSPLKDAAIPAWAIALALSFSAMTGVIFGMFPAIKAARLDPIVALRHE